MKEEGIKKLQRREDCSITKRNTHKPNPPSNSFFYINKVTALHPLLKKVRKALIQNNVPSVTLCGMGAAVSKTCMLALQIQDMIGGRAVCEVRVRTGTVEVIDELVPLDADKDLETQIRRNSKVEIDLVSVKKQT